MVKLGLYIGLVIFISLITTGVVMAQSKVTEIPESCSEYTEHYVNSVLVSTCDIESGQITIRDSVGTVTKAATPNIFQSRAIENSSCINSKSAARRLLTIPLDRITIEAIATRQASIETIILSDC